MITARGSASVDRETWLTANRKAISERLRWVANKPDGVLCVEPDGPRFVIVTKAGTQLRLLLAQQARPRTGVTQSHLDLSDPLHLVAPYMQAAMLGLLWSPQPGRIYTTGLGGGRVPLVWHHYLPDVLIECAEISPVVLNAAIRYFGLRTDARLRVAIQDGREWLAGRHEGMPYDIIFVDAFVDRGRTPYRLATIEFARLCRTHLSESGVLIVNLLEADPFMGARVKTIQGAFEQIYLCAVPGGNCVVFASHGPPLDRGELNELATAVQGQHRFSFPLVEHATALKTGPALRDHVPDLDGAQFLTDDAPPEGYFDRCPSPDRSVGRPDPA